MEIRTYNANAVAFYHLLGIDSKQRISMGKRIGG